MSEPVIRMENIVKTYYLGKPNELEILHGINLTVNKGEFVSIVGESGSGKSTLMNIIGVLDRQTQGDYYLEGQDVNGMSDEVRSAIRNRRIGFVFQNFNLLPRANALKNVMVPLLYGEEHSKNGKEHAMEMLKMVGMEDRADHRPNELSGGQKQRVAIARAMINDPGVVEDVMEKAGEVFDPSEFTHVEAMMLGEDFPNYLEEMDGCFAFIGGGDHPANHHGKFDFDEKALISGVSLMLTFVIV